MKLTFAGVGGAFTTQQYYQSNMVITADSGKRLLIDCGTDARFSFGELGATNANLIDWADGVYISHLHADHIGGLEWFGFCTFFGRKHKPKPKLYIADALVDDLWGCLKAGMKWYESQVLRLESFFDIHAIPANEEFVWEKIHFTPVKTAHITNDTDSMSSYGLLVDHKGHEAQFSGVWLKNDPDQLASFYVTTDTMFRPELQAIYDKAEVVFHDCETYAHRSRVHPHYDDLKTLPEQTKSKMWLYHYAPNSPQNPAEDGFRGFVTKGQTFEF